MKVRMYQNGMGVILVEDRHLAHQFVGALDKAYEWARRNNMIIIDLRHEGACYCGI
jgi:hypothetical protein